MRGLGSIEWGIEAAMLALGAAAEPSGRLLDRPGVGAVRVAPARDAVAAEMAVRGAEPIQVALAAAGRFEGTIQQAVQTDDRSARPSASHVTIVRDGWLDNAIRAERWDIVLTRSTNGSCQITEVCRAWLCRPGATLHDLAGSRCP